MNGLKGEKHSKISEEPRMVSASESEVIPSPVTVKFTQLFINGEFVNSVSGKTFETFDPRTGHVIAKVAEAEKEDVDLAVKAAREAFDQGPWPRLSGNERGRILRRFAELVSQHKDELAAIETWNSGKPISMCHAMDVPGSVSILEYYAGWADKIHGQTLKMEGEYQGYTLHEPIGVAGQIIPWNFPLIMFFSKISPALTCGCTVVIKPAEQTPLTALFCAHLAKQAGIPAGVLNVVTGYGKTGAAISSHMDIDKVAFTGSTEVGRLIMAAAANSNLKPVTLELGGKSPLFIMKDADLDQAVEIAHLSAFTNMGQVCLAASRIFVQEDIYEAFIKKAAERAKKQAIGDPFRPEVVHGPQVDETQYRKILEYIELGRKQGATLVTGGKPFGKGLYIEPTIFSDVQDDMRIAEEEIFGPVMAVLKFKTIEEAITRGNKTVYGLGAGVVTKDISIANRMARSLRAGTVWLNCYLAASCDCPIGGFKSSGFGREFGEYGLHSYLQVKSVVTPLSHSPWL